MPSILVVDDMAIFREPIAAALRLGGYQASCAADGEQALKAIAAQMPDLVLLDLAMPVMDGMTFLRRIRGDKRTALLPVILLTANSERQAVLEAATLGTRDYLLKSRFSLQELLQRVKKHLAGPEAHKGDRAEGRAGQNVATANNVAPVTKPRADEPPPSPTGESRPSQQASSTPARTPAPHAGSLPKLLDRDECIHRAEAAMQARTLSGVVAQVITMAASPRSDLSDLASLIARDPMLSARILQAANSVSYTSTRGMVSTIPEAVKNIGCATVRDIAASLGVFDAMPPCSADGFNPIRCWQHSFAVATLCQRLSGDNDSGVAYLIGLCHDLGEILFQTHFGAEYKQVLDAQEATGKRRDEVERKMLGMTHGELVLTILRCLGLPDTIRGPIEAFHSAGVANRPAADPAARVLRVADLYANGLLLASSVQAPLMPLTRAECRNATGVEEPLRPDATSLRSEIFALTAMLARLSARDEAELMTPPYPRRKVRVWLARDPSLTTFDPIAAALESLAEVTVSDHLPAPAESHDHDGLVVATRSTTVPGMGALEIAKAISPSASGSALPLLWLTGRLDGPVPPNLTPMLWPIPLSSIGEFVAQRHGSHDASAGG